MKRAKANKVICPHTTHKGICQELTRLHRILNLVISFVFLILTAVNIQSARISTHTQKKLRQRKRWQHLRTAGVLPPCLLQEITDIVDLLRLQRNDWKIKKRLLAKCWCDGVVCANHYCSFGPSPASH